MRYSAKLVAGVAVLALPACAMDGSAGPRDASVTERSATAAVRTSAGAERAVATATQIGDSIRVTLNTTTMPRGTYGAHIHAVGRCDAPDFASAGPHWNPTAQQHGKNNPAGMHKGDLPNLLVGTDGRATLEITIPSARITGGTMPMLDADGAAIVVHEKADDYRTDPSGNSGGRIACGVFG